MTEENSNRTADVDIDLQKSAAASITETDRIPSKILPRDVVHCFPANKSVILRRRVVSVVFGMVFLAGVVFFILPASFSLGLAVFAFVGFIVCILVIIQSFLIASYRVALDYEQREVVLRYQFQKIRIPFDDFDTREGQPDRAQTVLSSLPLITTKVPANYLILDNVRESACYQTANTDLASQEDFVQLKSEAENIRNTFRGKPEATPAPTSDDDELSKIINSALSDTPKNVDE